MKTCNTCKQSLDASAFYANKLNSDGLLGRCKVCHRAAMKEHRRAHPESYTLREQARYGGARRQRILDAATTRRRQQDPAKTKAQTAVGNAVRDGRLKKPAACVQCGREGVRLEGHHHDYGKPLDVLWLCSRCHRREHADHVAGAP